MAWHGAWKLVAFQVGFTFALCNVHARALMYAMQKLEILYENRCHRTTKLTFHMALCRHCHRKTFCCRLVDVLISKLPPDSNNAFNAFVHNLRGFSPFPTLSPWYYSRFFLLIYFSFMELVTFFSSFLSVCRCWWFL